MRAVRILGLLALAAALVNARVLHKPSRHNAAHPSWYPQGKEVDKLKSKGHTFHQVSELPFADSDDCTPIAPNFVSGYVNVTATAPKGTTLNMHYFAFPQDNYDDDAPVVVWWQGGPGAPSSFGPFVENGPYLWNMESYLGLNPSARPCAVPNPYSWTRFANLITVDQPAPIGYSYCTPPGPKPPGNVLTACGNWSDSRSARVTAEALRLIFDEVLIGLLPGRRLYFVGESYAGVYIADVTRLVATEAAYDTMAKHLEGVGLGNACSGGLNPSCFYAVPGDYFQFMYGHAQLPTEWWNNLNAVCTQQELYQMGPKCVGCTQQCIDIIAKIKEEIIGDPLSFTGYNLLDDCPQGNPSAPLAGSQAALPDVNASNGYACMGQVAFSMFNTSEARRAFGIPADTPFHSTDNGAGLNWVYDAPNEFDFWGPLITNTLKGSRLTHDIVLLSYNGDADPSVDVFATQRLWYEFAANYSLGKSSEWHPWVQAKDTSVNPTTTPYPDIVGGYVVEWYGGRVKYATARGSGHMVPEFRPLAGYVLISSLAQNLSPPPFVAPQNTLVRRTPHGHPHGPHGQRRGNIFRKPAEEEQEL